MKRQQTVWADVLKDLRNNKIFVRERDELTPTQVDWLEDYFLDQVLPVLTPLAIDPAHPFPFVPNLACIGLAIGASRRRQSYECPLVDSAAIEPLHHLA